MQNYKHIIFISLAVILLIYMAINTFKNQLGRYQLFTLDKVYQEKPASQELYRIDTETGKTWIYKQDNWKEIRE